MRDVVFDFPRKGKGKSRVSWAPIAARLESYGRAELRLGDAGGFPPTAVRTKYIVAEANAFGNHDNSKC